MLAMKMGTVNKNMITGEVEPLGGFIGSAFADPMFQGGQLLIILSFIMVQDPILGAAAIAFYPLQIYVIPKLQRRVNELGKRRVQNVRWLSEHIGESVSGIAEIHAHDAAHYELSRFANRLGVIYWIRYDIYRNKFFIKFLNNFIDKLHPAAMGQKVFDIDVGQVHRYSVFSLKTY